MSEAINRRKIDINEDDSEQIKIYKYCLDPRNSRENKYTLPRYIKYISERKFENIEEIINSIKRANDDIYGEIKSFIENNPKYKEYKLSKDDVFNAFLLNLDFEKYGFFLLQYKADESFRVNDETINKMIIDAVENKDLSEYINGERRKEFEKMKKEFLNKLIFDEEFNKLVGIESTNFELDRSMFKIELNNKMNYETIEFFDMINTNINVVLVSCGKYHKIYKNIEIPEKWLDNLDDISENKIILKLLSSTEFNEKKITEQYTDVEITINHENIEILMSTIVHKGINQQETIKRLMEVININDKKVESVDNISIAGVFYYPDNNINLNIFSDMVMNNLYVNKYMKIDEKSKLDNKIKSQLYLYYQDDNESVTCNITNQVIQGEQDKLLKEQYKGKFKKGGNYIRIRVTKTNNIDVLKNFKLKFDKFMRIYLEERDLILSEYNKFLSTSEKLQQNEIKEFKGTKKEYLKNLVDPVLFGGETGYVRQCRKAREPRVLSEDEINSADFENMKIMQNGEEYDIMKFPKDNAPYGKQHVYICDNDDEKSKEFRYPGVTTNSSKITQDRYPYIPCCFSRVQKGTRHWKKYFNDIDEDDVKDLGNQRIETGKRVLQARKEATISQNIDTLLNSYFNATYLRLGMNKTQNSVIECLEYVFNTNELEKNAKNISDYLNKKRIQILREIQTKSHINMLRQTNYEYNESEIIKNIENMNYYFDPKRYISILETYYKCNIIIFTRNNNEGDFVLPNHTNNYLRWNNLYDKTVLIFEHFSSDIMMSESNKDNQKLEQNESQCELIIFKIKKPKSGIEIMFNKIDKSNNLYDKLNELYDKINKTYFLNRINNKLEIFDKIVSEKVSKTCSIISQYIDKYGKTRILNIRYKENSFSVLTDPLPNFAVMSENIINSCKPIILSECLDFIKYIGGVITHKSYKDEQGVDKLTELHCKYNNISMTFIIDYGKSSDLEMSKIIDSRTIVLKANEFNTSIEESKLDIYNYMLKSSVILMEYAKYLFSHYLDEKNINYVELMAENYGKSIYNNFVKECMVVKEHHIYQDIGSSFNLENSNIIESKKLIICDKDPKKLIRGIIYGIRLSIQQEIPEILNLNRFIIYGEKKYINNMNCIKYYKDRVNMKNFYNSINDFHKYNNEIILKTTQDIKEWYNMRKNSIILSKVPIPGYKNLYLLENSVISKEIVLCNPTNIFSDAYNIGLSWEKYNYNPNNKSVPMFDIVRNFELIYYNENNKITRVKKSETENSKKILTSRNIKFNPKEISVNNIQIFGYKVDSKPEYVTLLNL